MSALLDQVIANTPQGGVTIARENHDFSTQSADCHNLATANGKISLMVAGDAPWHKLGVNVSITVNSADAIRLASLGWTVSKTELFYTDATGTKRKAPGVFGIVRDDTGEMLGDVGTMTRPIQNAEGFEFLDAVIGEFGARYETAGAIYGGKKVWMQVHLPKQAFAVAGGKDKVEPYAIFMNPHDGSGSAQCFALATRVVCANTYRVAAGSRKGGITIPHFGDVKAKIASAQEALGLAVKGFEDFAEKSKVLAKTPVGNVTHYANDVLDAVLEMTAADAAKETDLWAAVMRATEADRVLAERSFEQKAKARKSILDDVLERYESEKCGIGGIRGTAWAAFQAVTESADHGLLGGRQVGSDAARASRRFESILNGRADEVKQVAYTKALALAV
jgi:phage/plasmid-like protein (TIGR03299 family)